MAISTGSCSGRQPAITALTAIDQIVTSRPDGRARPSTRHGSWPPGATNASTRSGVGGMMASPSDQPRSANRWWISSIVPRATTSSAVGSAVAAAVAARSAR